MSETRARKYTVTTAIDGEPTTMIVELTDEQVAELTALGAVLKPRKDAN